MSLFPSLTQQKIHDLVKELKAGIREATLSGLFGASKALILAALVKATNRPVIVFSSAEKEAEILRGDLRFFLGKEVGYFPGQTEDLEARSQRVGTLKGLLLGELPAVVATLAGGLAWTIPPETLASLTLSLYPQRIIPMEEVLKALQEGGYTYGSQVVNRGEYSLRGGILDFFPPSAENPVRVEFFGDEIVSLREFHAETQRSIGPLSKISLLPVLEAPLTATFFQHLPSEAILAFDEPEELRAKAETLFRRRSGEEPLPGGASWDEHLLTWEAFVERAKAFPILKLETFPRSRVEGVSFTFETKSLPPYRGRFTELTKDLQTWRREGKIVHLVARSEAQGRRLQEVLKDHEVGAALGEVSTPGGIGILTGPLSAGFLFPTLGVIYVTEAEIFGPRPPLRRPLKPKETLPFQSFEDLKEGDYVVHGEHGIGRYLGLHQLVVGGQEGDYLLLEYADQDKLYVPVDKLSLIHRYVGADGHPPALDRLGGTSWAKAKERVKASIREMAKALLELYAARQVIKGYAFSPDTPWQKEFEAAFPYEETADQLKAIEDVKRDMEQDRPMDRLICGDVGYGKTEVALRAAFKAVMDGKQVAILVPTTVLALQHFQTFSERFAPFPVTVAMLSRFTPRKEQHEVVSSLKAGTVDIVIGTHRLLQPDVKFRDLGLLIVDEEHRFGVAAKEKLKQLKKDVDVLTLTATPIPRTLHMALLGVRDISTIETPPPERLSIHTVVARYDPALIQEAIERELSRGGQVFFVHNRVEDIQAVAKTLKRIVPSARLAVAHGEMSEERLERIMYDFYQGNYDVLLCTTIIESGLDIPTANTIIINRADQLGLAQLYQLRGRVGRDKERAYAYLLIPGDEPLTEQARKRLQVMLELTELGSGFKIALRDLEIRGAGNLLGPEQHGHIRAVGFDLYCQLVASTIKELKGEPEEPGVEPTLRLPVQGYLPEAYVPDPNLRLTLYKRLAAVENQDQLHEFEKELLDRFGEPPEPARWLLWAMEIKLLAKRLKIKELDLRKGSVKIAFAEHPPIQPERIVALLTQEKGRLRYLPEEAFVYEVRGGPRERLFALRNLLLHLV